MRFMRRLEVEGLWNARDLGGYAAAGGVTRFGVFVRCEAPCELPEAAVQALWDYGIRAAVDLRSLAESELRPSALASRMTCYACPQGGDAETFRPVGPVDWGAVYIQRVEDNKLWIRRVLELAAAQEGGMLFHCTTGKDRTGLIACFLLSIAGVARADVIADYCVSEVYLQPVFEAMLKGRLRVPLRKVLGWDETMFHTPPAAMARLLDHLEENYGSVPEYLRSAGVTDAVMDAIRRKLVEPDV